MTANPEWLNRYFENRQASVTPGAGPRAQTRIDPMKLARQSGAASAVRATSATQDQVGLFSPSGPLGPLQIPLDLIGLPGFAVRSALKEVGDAFYSAAGGQGQSASLGDFFSQIGQRQTWGEAIADWGGTGNKWADRVFGFVGDIALDPLAYVGGVGVGTRGVRAVTSMASGTATTVRRAANYLGDDAVAAVAKLSDDDILRAWSSRATGAAMDGGPRNASLDAAIGRAETALARLNDPKIRVGGLNAADADIIGVTQGLYLRAPQFRKIAESGGGPALKLLGAREAGWLTAPFRSGSAKFWNSRIGDRISKKFNSDLSYLTTKALRSGDPDNVVKALRFHQVGQLARRRAESAKEASMHEAQTSLRVFDGKPELHDDFWVRYLAVPESPEALEATRRLRAAGFSEADEEQFRGAMDEMYRRAVESGIPAAGGGKVRFFENMVPERYTPEGRAAIAQAAGREAKGSADQAFSGRYESFQYSKQTTDSFMGRTLEGVRLPDGTIDRAARRKEIRRIAKEEFGQDIEVWENNPVRAVEVYTSEVYRQILEADLIRALDDTGFMGSVTASSVAEDLVRVGNELSAEQKRLKELLKDVDVAHNRVERAVGVVSKRKAEAESVKGMRAGRMAARTRSQLAAAIKAARDEMDALGGALESTRRQALDDMLRVLEEQAVDPRVRTRLGLALGERAGRFPEGTVAEYERLLAMRDDLVRMLPKEFGEDFFELTPEDQIARVLAAKGSSGDSSRFLIETQEAILDIVRDLRGTNTFISQVPMTRPAPVGPDELLERGLDPNAMAMRRLFALMSGTQDPLDAQRPLDEALRIPRGDAYPLGIRSEVDPRTGGSWAVENPREIPKLRQGRAAFPNQPFTDEEMQVMRFGLGDSRATARVLTDEEMEALRLGLDGDGVASDSSKAFSQPEGGPVPWLGPEPDGVVPSLNLDTRISNLESLAAIDSASGDPISQIAALRSRVRQLKEDLARRERIGPEDARRRSNRRGKVVMSPEAVAYREALSESLAQGGEIYEAIDTLWWMADDGVRQKMAGWDLEAAFRTHARVFDKVDQVRSGALTSDDIARIAGEDAPVVRLVMALEDSKAAYRRALDSGIEDVERVERLPSSGRLGDSLDDLDGESFLGSVAEDVGSLDDSLLDTVAGQFDSGQLDSWQTGVGVRRASSLQDLTEEIRHTERQLAETGWWAVVEQEKVAGLLAREAEEGLAALDAPLVSGGIGGKLGSRRAALIQDGTDWQWHKARTTDDLVAELGLPKKQAKALQERMRRQETPEALRPQAATPRQIRRQIKETESQINALKRRVSIESDPKAVRGAMDFGSRRTVSGVEFFQPRPLAEVLEAIKDMGPATQAEILRRYRAVAHTAVEQLTEMRESPAALLGVANRLNLNVKPLKRLTRLSEMTEQLETVIGAVAQMESDAARFVRDSMRGAGAVPVTEADVARLVSSEGQRAPAGLARALEFAGGGLDDARATGIAGATRKAARDRVASAERKQVSLESTLSDLQSSVKQSEDAIQAHTNEMLRLSQVKSMQLSLHEGAGGAVRLSNSGSGVYTTTEVAEALAETVKFAKLPQFIQKYYSPALAYWRGWVLLSPGFHLRNFMGGVFNNWMADVPFKYNTRALAANLYFKGTLSNRPALVKTAKSFNRNAKQLESDAAYLAELIEDGWLRGGMYAIEQGRRAISSLKPWRNNFALLGASQKLGDAVEISLRYAIFLHRVETAPKGMVRAGRAATSGRAVNSTAEGMASDAVAQFHFDYGDLNQFERKLKLVIPFYVWTRRNVPLQFEMMARRPIRYNALRSFERNMQLGTDPDSDDRPEWIDQRWPVKLPFELGSKPTYLMMDLPIRDAAEVSRMVTNPREALGIVSPYVKTPLEMLASRDLERGLSTDYQVRFPKAWKAIPPLYAALKASGAITENEEGEELIDATWARAIESNLPLLARLRRLFPSEPSQQERAVSSWMGFAGLPVRQLTDADQRLARREAGARANESDSRLGFLEPLLGGR